MHALTSTRMKKIASSKLNKKDVEQKHVFTNYYLTTKESELVLV